MRLATDSVVLELEQARNDFIHYHSSQTIPVEPSIKLPFNVDIIAWDVENKIAALIEEDQQNEVPVFFGIRRGFIRELAYKYVKNPHKRLSIGIAGESASGKSTLVKDIKSIIANYRKCEDEAYINTIEGDNYYKDTSKEVLECGGFAQFLDKTGYNFDEPQALDLKRMHKDIIHLTEGKSINLPVYDKATCKNYDHSEKTKPGRIIIAENLFCLNPEVRDAFDIKIFVKVASTEMKNRWYARSERFDHNHEAMNAFFEKVTTEAEKYIRPNEQVADFVVNGNSTLEQRRAFLVKLLGLLRIK